MANPNIFPGIPNVTTSQDIPADLKLFLSSMKDNIELLNRSKGDIAKPWQAILKGDITIGTVSDQAMKRSNATGAFNATDHAQLVADFQIALQDIAILRSVLVALLTQLKA